jgi:hypothetical protein
MHARMDARCVTHEALLHASGVGLALLPDVVLNSLEATLGGGGLHELANELDANCDKEEARLCSW